MGRYLQSVESHYPASRFHDGAGAEADRVREAATAYAHALRRGKVEARGIAKVILVDRPAESRVEDLLDVLRYEHPLRQHAWVNALPHPHERYVGEMHHALRELGGARGWGLEALDSAYRRVLLADHRFVGVHAKPRWNKSRSCMLSAEWLTTDEVRCCFVVIPVRGEEGRVTFMTSPIGLGKIECVSASLAWEDDRRAVLWHRNRRDRWRIDVDTMDVDFVYGPAEAGNSHGMYALGRMYLDGSSWTVRDRDKARLWLEKSANSGFAHARALLAGLN